MQEKITLESTEALVFAVTSTIDGEPSAMFEFIRQHQSSLQSMIEGYWFSKKGNVLELAIDRESIRFNSAVNGIFVVKYKVSYFFACDDITTDNRESMPCTFFIDLPGRTVTIEGENVPERTPDEF